MQNNNTPYLFDLKNDYAFKKVFGTPANEQLTLDILNVMLEKQLESKLVSVSFPNSEQQISSSTGKTGRLDVICQDQQGNRYIIEMQRQQEEDFRERVQHYAATELANQLQRGQTYSQLPSVILLAFLDFSLFPQHQHYISHHSIREHQTGENELKNLRFTFVDLPKFKQSIQGKPLASLTHQERLCKALKDASQLNKTDIDILTQNDPIMQQVLSQLETQKWDNQERARYLQAERWDMDYHSSMAQARNKGRQEGRQDILNALVRQGKLSQSEAQALRI